MLAQIGRRIVTRHRHPWAFKFKGDKIGLRPAKNLIIAHGAAEPFDLQVMLAIAELNASLLGLLSDSVEVLGVPLPVVKR